jgi:hypothetical protein
MSPGQVEAHNFLPFLVQKSELYTVQGSLVLEALQVTEFHSGEYSREREIAVSVIPLDDVVKVLLEQISVILEALGDVGTRIGISHSI